MVFSEYTKGATSLPAAAIVRLGGAGVNGTPVSDFVATFGRGMPSLGVEKDSEGGMARLKAFGSARMKKSWYSTAEVARRVGLSKRETLHLIKGGEIKAIWIGGSAGYRISELALEKLLKGRPDRR